MKKILIASIIVVIAGIFVSRYLFRKPDDSVKSEKTDLKVSADDLFQAFNSDETNANKIYLNKILEIEGVVGEISELNESYSVYLKVDESTLGILCGFNKNVFTPENINPGDKVIIKGLCTGFLFDVVINKCVLAD